MSFEIGETVTVRGTAHTAAAGAMVAVDDNPPIYVVGLREWSEELEGKPVEVTGVLKQRPSRIPKVPPGGVHSHGSGAALVLDDASWTPVT